MQIHKRIDRQADRLGINHNITERNRKKLRENKRGEERGGAAAK